MFLPPRKEVFTATGAPEQLLATLRAEVRRLEGARRPANEPRISSGSPALNRLLPGGGLSRGTLVEWLSAEPGGGAGTLALLAAREAGYEGGALVVFDRERSFYPPAAAALGLDLEQVVVVRPANLADELWALDQALACPGVAAVWGSFAELDAKTWRRLQLAAEAGGTLGLFVRPAQARGQPTWSEIQFLVQPRVATAGRRWRVELARVHGGATGGSVELELDEATGQLREIEESHETHALPLVSRLAVAAAGGYSA